jgi:hypothetical protein
VDFELRLPDIGEGIAEGEIVAWLVAEGTPVKEDDLLVEILTDKAAMEMPSPVTGILVRIVARGGKVPRSLPRPLKSVPRAGMSWPLRWFASWPRISGWTLRPYPGRARRDE